MFNQKRRSKIVNRSELLVVLSTNHIAEQLYHKHIPLDSNTTHIWLNRYLIIFNVHYRNELQWMLLIQNYFIHQVAKFFFSSLIHLSPRYARHNISYVLHVLWKTFISEKEQSRHWEEWIWVILIILMTIQFYGCFEC